MSVFDHPLVVAAGLELTYIELQHHGILEELDRPDLGLRSPIRRMRVEKGWLRDLKDRGCLSYYSDVEKAELVFVFTRPFAEVRGALDQGREFFRAEAIRIVEEPLNEILLEELGAAVMDAFNEWLETVETNGGFPQ